MSGLVNKKEGEKEFIFEKCLELNFRCGRARLHHLTGGLITPIFSIISGFIGAQLFNEIDIRLPYIVSLVFLSLTCIITIFLIKEPKQNVLRPKQFLTEYEEACRNLILEIKNIPYFFSLLLFFSIPSILDIGPSNQWQIFFQSNNYSSWLGFMWVLIGVSTILANFLVNKFLSKKTQSDIKNLMLFMLLDMALIILLAINFLNPLFFLLHVLFMGIISTTILSYIHENIIKNSESRASIVSTFYAVEALLVSGLLFLNGIISEQAGY